jgi:nucleoside-diphosphate-sugar epimerase
VGRFLVTGCAGFIGSHLVEDLLEGGNDVVGVDAFTDYYERATKEANLAEASGHTGFSFVEADLAEADPDALVDGVDGVFHLAAQPGVRGSWGDSFGVYVRDNILATQRLFEAAARLGVKVVFASSSSIYGDAEAHPTPEDVRPRPISPYGVTKLACEHLAQAYVRGFGLNVASMRYFTVFGPRQRPDMAFTRIVRALVLDEQFHVFGTGEQSRDFTFVADAVAATRAAMDRAPAGAAYNVGGGTEASLADVIRTCERLSGHGLNVVHEEPMAGDVRRTAADTSRIRDELGWEPRTPLEAGLRAQLEWAEQAAAVSGSR